MQEKLDWQMSDVVVVVVAAVIAAAAGAAGTNARCGSSMR